MSRPGLASAPTAGYFKRWGPEVKRALVVAIGCVIAACATGQPSYSEVRLPSGNLIKVLGTVRVLFRADDPALMLKYRTECSLEDKAALQREVDEIWTAFRNDIERAGVKNAIISANEPRQGFIITTTRSFNFVYKRSADGTWEQLGTPAIKPVQPTRAAGATESQEPAPSGPRG